MTSRAAVLVCAVVLAGCGGGTHASNASGGSPPTALILPGAGPIPVSQLTSAATQMCSIVAQSHSAPGAVLQPFYAGPHDDLHLLAAIANAKHRAQSQNLLNVMLTYEAAIAAKPPPPETGQDADALLQTVDATLSALGVPPPTC